MKRYLFLFALVLLLVACQSAKACPTVGLASYSTGFAAPGGCGVGVGYGAGGCPTAGFPVAAYPPALGVPVYRAGFHRAAFGAGYGVPVAVPVRPLLFPRRGVAVRIGF